MNAWLRVWKGLTTPEDKRRASICEVCEFRNHTKFLDYVNDDVKEVQGFICGKCKCALSAKIRSKDKCFKW